MSDFPLMSHRKWCLKYSVLWRWRFLTFTFTWTFYRPFHSCADSAGDSTAGRNKQSGAFLVFFLFFGQGNQKQWVAVCTKGKREYKGQFTEAALPMTRISRSGKKLNSGVQSRKGMHTCRTAVRVCNEGEKGISGIPTPSLLPILATSATLSPYHGFSLTCPPC